MALVTLLLAWTVAVVSPGPDFLAVLRTAAIRGRRTGVITGLGVVTGIACWATLALTGLSLLLTRYVHLYLALRVAGAVFLVLYGLHIVVTLVRTRGRGGAAPAAGPVPTSAFRLGLATNLANPKAVLFFGALFASLMPPHLPALAKVAVVLVMLVMGAAWFSLVAVLAGSPAVMRGYQRIERKLDAVAGGLFITVGAALLPR